MPARGDPLLPRSRSNSMARSIDRHAPSARRRSRACLAHFLRKFISRASPSDRAGRYFRATRAHVPDYFLIYETGSGRLAPSPGALPFARARPARSARSSHTPCPPVPPATPPRSTRTCAQDGLGLEEEARRRSETAGGRAWLESRRWRVHPPRRAPCAPARAAAVVTRPLGIAVGRACEGAGEESVRACLNVGGFALCVHTDRRF